MNRLELESLSKADLVINDIYNNLASRIKASPLGLCPVEVTKSFLELCLAQSCGKCIPCRIGLLQLKNLMDDVLEGRANDNTLDLIEQTSKMISETADCAIGTEASHMVYVSITSAREEYEYHVHNNRCLSKTSTPVPCVGLCPAHVDVPGYLAMIKEGRYQDAVRVIRKDNPFPTTCSFICEHPCEARCRRNMIDSSINIRGLKRYAADKAGFVKPPEVGPSTGKKVAIVGGGPAGLSAAYYLQLMGHQTTVFEMLPELGGMLRYGIPNYRLPKERLDEDIKAILDTGVEVKYGIKISRDLTLNDLRNNYDATLITIGASTDKKLGLEGEDADGVISAVDFLRGVGLGKKMDLKGKKAAVIGGGNVAMDALRTLVRLNAEKVTCVYRRRVSDMTALPVEIEGAVAEGCEMLTLKSPSRLEIEDGKLKGIWVSPQMISNIKNNRASVKSNGMEDEFIPCEVLVVAIGQDIESSYYEKEGIPVERGKIFTLPNGGFRGIPGLYAGGDCQSGPATVIKAIAAAKVMAANIDQYLGYNHQITCDVKIPDVDLEDKFSCGRSELSDREASIRIRDFESVELNMEDGAAMQEVSRCLRCDKNGFGIFRGGRIEKW